MFSNLICHEFLFCILNLVDLIMFFFHLFFLFVFDFIEFFNVYNTTFIFSHRLLSFNNAIWLNNLGLFISLLLFLNKFCIQSTWVISKYIIMISLFDDLSFLHYYDIISIFYSRKSVSYDNCCYWSKFLFNLIDCSLHFLFIFLI